MADWVSYVRVEASEAEIVDLVTELRGRFGKEHVRSRTLLAWLDEDLQKPDEPFFERQVASFNGSHARLRRHRQ